MRYSLLRQSVSWRVRCRLILHYYTSMNSRDFPCETDNTSQSPKHILSNSTYVFGLCPWLVSVLFCATGLRWRFCRAIWFEGSVALMRDVLMKTCSLCSSPLVNLQVSEPYSSTDLTLELNSLDLLKIWMLNCCSSFLQSFSDILQLYTPGFLKTGSTRVLSFWRFFSFWGYL